MYPILTKAEIYSATNDPKKSRPSPKIKPYSSRDAVYRAGGFVDQIVRSSRNIKPSTLPEEKLVTKLTLHPSYLAKSYFPTNLLKHFGLEYLGSKEVSIRPNVRVTKAQKKSDEILSSQLFIAGKISDYNRMLEQLSLSELSYEVIEDFSKVESFSIYDADEKFDPTAIDIDSDQRSTYEVVLYSESLETNIYKTFEYYITNIGGDIDSINGKSIDGLTFIFVSISGNLVHELAKFSFVRVVRNAPIIKIFPVENATPLHHDGIFQETSPVPNSLQMEVEPAEVAVFDGGLPKSLNPSLQNIRYFDLTNSKIDDPKYTNHGANVTSAISYGDQGSLEQNKDIVNVDHYNVISAEDDALSSNLYVVLERIQHVLRHKKYRIVNICLGPSIPIPDDEPNLWTSVLDKLAESGETLFIIAGGNDGECLDSLGAKYARIQPPADMLNGIGVGSANSRLKDWKRASYSCIGPGRKPGFVKPDLLHFGGTANDEQLLLKRLDGPGYINVHGTSFSAALITRQAALLDKYTNKKFNIATLRALLVNSANSSFSLRDVGWGCVPSNIYDHLYCSKNKVTFVYQGSLKKKSGVRAAIPFTEDLPPNTKVVVTSTLCFYSEVDIRNPVSYSKTGVSVTFKPHLERLQPNSNQPKPKTFFSCNNIYKSEQALREDHHRWETCFKVSQRMMAKTLSQPVFDIRFSERADGHNYDSKSPLNYSLVVTIEIEKLNDYNFYESVTNKYPLLTPIELNIDSDVNIDLAV
ncbi:hypothetical protein TUM4438_36540 [Shewanella sairae]|uniref:Peptidase S8/S53 domain-containing protein n=1 Tax=Shewanella sairae TaxID=190310 RepID=A0ABQ4PP78_9GAMM|nr:S8 family peptidase [Shewanella sairae]MCL1132101.1 S8 family peptidase [Shewanella sairae]GIU50459.1 hypothetical protein TUM4438_36540 [Shewanella sairae]